MDEMRKKLFVSPQTILKFLISDDDKTDTLIMCKSAEVDLVTDGYSIYEALGSIKQYDKFQLNKLTKLLEVVEILPRKREQQVLTHERVEELRREALSKGGVQE
ncbi:hypothetical protein HY638_05950 [Candidatus Woesearchaeota archaeon]|nr:hypothetical protein [Candidatus Woesearchaeota archaeon]